MLENEVAVMEQDNYKRYIGMTVVVMLIGESSVFIGKVEGTSPHRVRFKRLMDGREMKLLKDEIYLFDDHCYEQLSGLMSDHRNITGSIQSFVAGNRIRLDE